MHHIFTIRTGCCKVSLTGDRSAGPCHLAEPIHTQHQPHPCNKLDLCGGGMLFIFPALRPHSTASLAAPSLDPDFHPACCFSSSSILAPGRLERHFCRQLRNSLCVFPEFRLTLMLDSDPSLMQRNV